MKLLSYSGANARSFCATENSQPAHYEFLGDHFKTVKGYDAYQQKAEIARKGGLAGAVDGFMKAASWGNA